MGIKEIVLTKTCSPRNRVNKNRIFVSRLVSQNYISIKIRHPVYPNSKVQFASSMSANSIMIL